MNVLEELQSLKAEAEQQVLKALKAEAAENADKEAVKARGHRSRQSDTFSHLCRFVNSGTPFTT